MRKAGMNNLVIATMFLSSVLTQKRQRFIDSALQPLLRWFEEAAHQCRSVKTNFKWMFDQISKDFQQHLQDILGTFQSEGSLQWVGIEVPRSDGLGGWVEHEEVVISDDDWLCSGWADLAVVLVGCRLTRCAHMISGFSCRSILWTSPDLAVRRQEMERFYHAVQDFKWLKSSSTKSKDSPEFIRRSQFQLLAVQQLVAAMEVGDMKRGASHLKWLRMPSRGRKDANMAI